MLFTEIIEMIFQLTKKKKKEWNATFILLNMHALTSPQNGFSRPVSTTPVLSWYAYISVNI